MWQRRTLVMVNYCLILEGDKTPFHQTSSVPCSHEHLEKSDTQAQWETWRDRRHTMAFWGGRGNFSLFSTLFSALK